MLRVFKNISLFLLLFHSFNIHADEDIFGTAEWLPASLQGKVYKLPPNTGSLPDFSTLSPMGNLYATAIDIPERAWSEGFPGISNLYEWFAVDYHGTFNISKEGTYHFRLASDDGSKLLINDSLVINNDGTHGTTSRHGSIALKKGPHKINVQYFQGPRYHIALQLFVRFEDFAEESFPSEEMRLETPPEMRFVRPKAGAYQLMLDVEFGEVFHIEVQYDEEQEEASKMVEVNVNPEISPIEVEVIRTDKNKFLYRSKKLSVVEE